MDRIVIIGGGGHAKVLISILKKNAQYEIVGYTDKKNNGSILGVEYLGDDNILRRMSNVYGCCRAVLGIGNISVVHHRRILAQKTKELGLVFPSIISPNAIINEDVRIGEGTVVFDGVVVNSGTEIGNFAILNTNSTIEHDCVIGNYVHVAPAATLCGGVKIGENSMIGVGANVLQSVIVGEDCMIGAGATVIADCLIPGTYTGVPARLYNGK